MLTKVDGHAFVYDDIGNPTSYYNGTQWTFGWSNGRRLTSASGGGNTLSYTYDADGIRTSKTVNGTEHVYYYAGGKLLRETYGNNTLDFFYDVNGNPYALKYNNTLYYYITNLQGDVMYIVNGSGQEVAAYTYDPYGNVITATGTLAEVNPLRYRGYYYDSETGFYYLQSRYYDPELGRFINADTFASTGQGILGNNMFAYCLNNPVNSYDPAGYYRFDIEPCAFSDGYGGNDMTVPVDSIYSKTIGLINGQKASEYSEVPFGWGMLGNNGCGPIAVYNAMQLLGHRASLGLIVDYFEYGSGLWMCGLFGITPWSIDSYFLNRGISCKGYTSYAELKANLTEGSVVLFMVMNDASDLFAGCHYMTAQYSAGQFICYNMGNYRTQSVSVPTLEPVYGNAGWIYGYIIGG